MSHTSDILNHLPPMLTGDELAHALTVLPEYDESIRNESPAVCLMALSELFKIYISSPMSQEIYSKLYLALMRSLQKKGSKEAIRQRYENHKGARQLEYRGIQKMLSSDRLSTYEVCLFAMFLRIPPADLVKMTLPEISQPEWFDQKIRTLHSQGMKYPEIARIMRASYDVVKAIGEGRY